MDKITILLNQGHKISKFGGLSRIRIPMANFIKLVLWWNIAILDFLFFFVSAYVCVCEKRQLRRCEETPSQEQFGLRVVSGLVQPLFPWNRKIQKSRVKNVTLKDSLAGHSSSSCFKNGRYLLILSLPIWTLNQIGPTYEARVEKPMTSRDEIVPILLGQFFEFNEEYLSWLPEIFRK